MKRSLRLLFLSLCLSSASLCFAADERSGDASGPPSHALVPVSSQPYDLSVCGDKSPDEVADIAQRHFDTRADTPGKVIVYDCFVDENWRIRSDIFQGIHVRFPDNKAAQVQINIEFDSKLAGLRLSYCEPPAHVFFYWKQAGWVNPHYAEGLSHALIHGFRDKIMPNPVWAPYWLDRARMLRASRTCVIPNDPDLRDGMSVEEKISIMLAVHRYH